METMASCEGGQKWNKPVDLIVTPASPPVVPQEPPQVICNKRT